jgi:hypothetical protein
MSEKNLNLISSYINDEAGSDTSNKKKVIRMTSDGFCLSILSESKGLEAVFQYSFAPHLSFASKIAAIAAVDKERDISCDKNVFRLYTKYNVQIPEEFHDGSNNEAILSVTVSNDEQYIPFEEKVDGWKLYNISAWEKELYAEVKTRFPNCQFSTVVTSLLNIIAKQKKEKKALIFVENNNFTIIAVDNRQLTGINTFPFYTEKDFLYYCYAFLRKIFVEPEHISLKLCGNIAKQSSLYSAISKYCQDVDMLSGKGNTVGDNYSYYCDLFE